VEKRRNRHRQKERSDTKCPRSLPERTCYALHYLLLLMTAAASYKERSLCFSNVIKLYWMLR